MDVTWEYNKRYPYTQHVDVEGRALCCETVELRTPRFGAYTGSRCLRCEKILRVSTARTCGSSPQPEPSNTPHNSYTDKSET